ncbi:MAG: hypothetical protein JWO86_9021 [Myxococcaceae bacterium]|nr:hypothetical protein [Myxococcaceae bacterium]
MRKTMTVAFVIAATALVPARSFAQETLPPLPPLPVTPLPDAPPPQAVPDLPPPPAPAPALPPAPAPAPALPPAPAPALPPAPAPAPPPAPADESPKRFGIGLDAQLLFPVGQFSNYTGVQLGPLLRLGYRVVPRLEATLRSGYLFGLNTTSGAGISLNVTNIPIWLGARYWFMDPSAGVYGAVEIGANLMQSHFDANGGPFVPSGSAALNRGGFNLGAGYVLSKELPIDVRLQFSYLNLIAADPADGSLVSIGLSVGYTFQL